MSSLEQRQKECRLYVDRIGDILDTHMSNMAAYMVRSAHVVRRRILTGIKEYCVNHGNAIKVLQTLREEKPNLGSILQVRIQPHEYMCPEAYFVSNCVMKPLLAIWIFPAIYWLLVSSEANATLIFNSDPALKCKESLAILY